MKKPVLTNCLTAILFVCLFSGHAYAEEVGKCKDFNGKTFDQNYLSELTFYNLAIKVPSKISPAEGQNNLDAKGGGKFIVQLPLITAKQWKYARELVTDAEGSSRPVGPQLNLAGADLKCTCYTTVDSSSLQNSTYWLFGYQANINYKSAPVVLENCK